MFQNFRDTETQTETQTESNVEKAEVFGTVLVTPLPPSRQVDVYEDPTLLFVVHNKTPTRPET